MERSEHDRAHYASLLRIAAPDLVLDRFDDLGQGWDNILFLVNRDLVVRFARDARVARQLLVEDALLRLIRPLLPVPIPIPDRDAWSSEGRDVALMVYRLIPGVPLESLAISDELVAAIAPSLARLLDALHSVTGEAMSSIAIPRFTPGAWVEHEHELFLRTRVDLRDALDAATFHRYDEWWRRYLDDRVSTAFAPCLVHGDLVPEHIVVEREPRRVSGVIDFGDAMWTDPALDLAGLPARLARLVVSRMKTLSNDEGWWIRRDAYRRIAPLHAIAAGREHGSLELLQSGIDAIRQVESS